MKRNLFMCLLLAAIGMVSCNRHEETPLETEYPIYTSYMPASVIFSNDDTEFLDKCKEWNGKMFVINFIDELPADPLGFPESIRNLNLQNQTLLLYYDLHLFDISTYSSRWVRDNREKTFNWTIHIGFESLDPDSREIWFSRFAVLVRKLPENAEVKVWTSLSDLNWEWDQDKD